MQPYTGAGGYLVGLRLFTLGSAEARVALPPDNPTLLGGNYVYTRDLLTSGACHPRSRPKLPSWLRAINSPLHMERWECRLRSHPDWEFVTFLLEGLQEGFQIGFEYEDLHCRSATRNMRLAAENPKGVDDFLTNKCACGRVIGPLSADDVGTTPPLQISCFGVIPKSHQEGKWRLIVDLSDPKGASVNDGIRPSLCSLNYTSVDDAVEVALRMGRGCRMAKLDVISVYQIVPVHPEDRLLLGMW